MELKPGYEQTEVGMIPEDWDVKRLREISPSQSVGLVINPSSYFEANGEVPMLVGSCISENKINSEKASRISSKNSERLTACRLKAGDLVTVRVGFPGTTAVVPTELDGCNCASMMIIRSHKSFDSYWLAQLLNSPIGRAQIENVEYGTAQKQFNISDAINFVFPVPPPAEQSRIAEAARNFDDYIESLEQKIGKKREIKQAAMQELLTGKRRLPGFEGEWEVKRLGDVAHIKTGSRNNEDKTDDGEYPFFVRSDNVERISSYSYDCEAVLVPGEGRIGEIFHYIKGRFDVHQRVYAITQFAQEISGKFIHCYMAMNFGSWAMQNTVKATVDSLRLPTFQTFEMWIPPTKDEQDAIAGVLIEINAELAALEARKNKAQQLKQGMMQQLLTGKIRLT